MFDFDDDFDMEDATIIGGIMGFAEESIREENRQLEDINEEDYGLDEVTDRDTNLRLLRNENPGLVKYLLSLVIKQKRQWAKARMAREQRQRDMKSVKHELEAMERTGCAEGDNEG